MSNKVKVTAVSYLNTEPFIYGLNHSGLMSDMELETDIPSRCADKLIHDQTDIGLIPVAAIPAIKSAQIITDYCIGAVGKVASVMLYSHVPVNQIKKVLLDYQSRTSVALVKVLAKEYWQISPEWIPAQPGFETQVSDHTAVVVIGDRAFALNNTHPYEYDLAEVWTQHTGMPFVFACWVSNKIVSEDFTERFNRSLHFGQKNIEKVVELCEKKTALSVNIRQYLTQNISYSFDSAKKQGMQLFLEKLRAL